MNEYSECRPATAPIDLAALERMRRTLDELFEVPERCILLCHPENAAEIARLAQPAKGMPVYPLDIAGMEIVPHRWVPKTRVEWRPPEEAFWSYEDLAPETVHWMRRLGFGRTVVTQERVVFKINMRAWRDIFMPILFGLAMADERREGEFLRALRSHPTH